MIILNIVKLVVNSIKTGKKKLQKGKVKLVLLPFPPYNVVPLIELLITENNKHPNFEQCHGEGGGVCIL